MAQISRRSQEGYLLVDNRVSGGGVVEASIITCGHCHRQMIVNPDRTRARGYCAKCNHYTCDGCELIRVVSGECRNLNATMERIQEQAGRNLNLQEI